MASISDSILLEEWLLRQPVATSELFANRIALRMIPFWQEFYRQKELLPSELGKSFPLWWNLFSTWVHYSSDSKNPKIIESKKASEKFYVSNSKTQFGSFFSARSQNDRSLNLAKFNNQIVASVCNLVSSDEPAHLMWEELSADADAIDAGRSLQFISQRHLWSTTVTPQWVSKSWEQQKKLHLDSPNNWVVWTEWYESRLNGRGFDEALYQRAWPTTYGPNLAYRLIECAKVGS